MHLLSKENPEKNSKLLKKVSSVRTSSITTSYSCMKIIKASTPARRQTCDTRHAERQAYTHTLTRTFSMMKFVRNTPERSTICSFRTT